MKGTLHTQHRQQRATEYTVKNSGRKEKNVLIEYGLEPDWKLLEPEKPSEQTRDRYRFLMEAAPGKPAKLTVREERAIHNQFALTNLDDNTILYYINEPIVSDRIKEAMREVIRRKQEIATLAAQRGQLEQEIATIGQEQARIRENMAQLERNSDLYNRYVKKFGEQEDRIEELRVEIAGLMEQETTKRQALEAYLLELNLE